MIAPSKFASHFLVSWPDIIKAKINLFFNFFWPIYFDLLNAI